MSKVSFDFVQVVGTSHAFDPSGLPQEVADPVNTGRRMLAKNRKMLDIELSGDGVSAGNNVAGVAANAYGEGEDNGLHGTHIRVRQYLGFGTYVCHPTSWHLVYT